MSTINNLYIGKSISHTEQFFVILAFTGNSWFLSETVLLDRSPIFHSLLTKQLWHHCDSIHSQESKMETLNSVLCIYLGISDCSCVPNRFCHCLWTGNKWMNETQVLRMRSVYFTLSCLPGVWRWTNFLGSWLEEMGIGTLLPAHL